MSEDTQPKHGLEFEPDAKQLYLAQFKKESGTIMLRNHGEQPIVLSGEILVAGQLSSEKTLIVEEIQRISLWSEPLEELRGLLSLAGPATEITIAPGPIGEVAPFDMWLYYPLLSDQGPACTESDALYPHLEILQGRLIREPKDAISDKELRVLLTLIVDKLTVSLLGAVEQFAFGPVELSFRPLEQQPFTVPQAHSLASCSSVPPPGTAFAQRSLSLQFVNLSRIRTSPTDLAQLELIVQNLIDCACEVWWAKGGIKITPQPITIITPPTPVGFTCSGGRPGFCVSVLQETAANPTQLQTISAVANAVEVYLVDELTGNSTNPRKNGGVTYNCGTSDAYIILEIGKAENNCYLLAHEVGHVLGLSHPASAGGGGCPGYPMGSDCSVMVPDRPNSPRNTDQNFTLSSLPLGPVFTSLGLSCGRNVDPPQGFFHILRDFAYDDGTVLSVPRPPVSSWWTHSDVWNSDKSPYSIVDPDNLYNDGTLVGAPMFGPDTSPIHTEPQRIGTNHMYARLHTCETLTQPVNVHLFLAVPGASGSPLTPVGAGPLVFSSALGTLPTPGVHKTGHTTWTVPAGYPAHCCVFAVAVSGNEATPPDITAIITTPAAHTFFDLFNFVASSNDVVQRNLHIQETISVRSAPLWSTLAWVELSNPFEQAAPAGLEIDTSMGEQLAGLVLEVNGTTVREVMIGAPAMLSLTDLLQPGDHMILRLRALVPPDIPETTIFPINMRFFVGDKLISGYQHMLRVGPLSVALAQVLDTLYGALMDVAVGCRADGALALANSVAGVAARHAEDPEKALDTLAGLAASLASVSQSIDPNSEPECQAVRRRLFELAGLLLTWSSIPALGQFTEQIRELADRILELAGWLVRRAQ